MAAAAAIMGMVWTVGSGEAQAATTHVRPGAELRLPASTAPVAKLVVSTRTRGCRHTRVAVQVNGVSTASLRVTSHVRRTAVGFATPPAAGAVALLAHRCGFDVLRLKVIPAAPAPTAAAPIPLGTAITEKPLSDPAYVATLLSTYQSVSTENELKMDRTQPREGDYEFGSADNVVGFATRHHLPIRGHTLIFGTQTPKWVKRLPLPELVKSTLEDQVKTVMSRYKDRIHEWDVVNEALHQDGGWRHNPFYDKLGPAYVEDAFRAARAADPTAKLYYNEIGAEFDNPKRAAMIELVTKLKREGLIDGVGLQMHMNINQAPTYDQLVATMQLFEALGLDVQITEMDVTTDGLFVGDRLARQAEIYADAGRACRLVAACKRLTVWGVGDRVSWLSPSRQPLLFDTDFQPKPALPAVLDALR